MLLALAFDGSTQVLPACMWQLQQPCSMLPKYKCLPSLNRKSLKKMTDKQDSVWTAKCLTYIPFPKWRTAGKRQRGWTRIETTEQANTQNSYSRFSGQMDSSLELAVLNIYYTMQWSFSKGWTQSICCGITAQRNMYFLKVILIYICLCICPSFKLR